MQLIFLFLCIFASYGKIFVDTSTQFLTDGYKRHLFFHGLNAVYKKFPFYPNTTTFSPLTSLCEEDFQNLQEWGFNFIRLYASWEGIESTKGQYNETLIGELKSIVQLASKYNISILLDAHQDVANRKFCGEGFPDWAVSSTQNFPEPIESPDKMNINESTQYPSLTDCYKKNFALYYYSYGVSTAFQNFYTNVDNLTDHFAGMWKILANEFKDQENVIGYELLNEPWFGDIYKDKGLLVDSDTKLLQPFYKKIAEQIREVDNETLVFFEPNVMEDLYIDMKATPLGKPYLSKEVFSFHLYCGFQDKEAIERDACNAIIDGRFDVSYKKGKELGAGLFVTEFGAKQDDNEDVMQLNYTISKTEDNFLSWAYWQFKEYDDYTTQLTGATESLYFANGTLQENKLKAFFSLIYYVLQILSRSYFYAICGKPEKTGFDATLYSQTNGGTLYLQFYPDNCAPKNTEFYLSEHYYYQNGFVFDVQGCNGMTYNRIKNHYYELIVPSECIGKLVKVSISAKEQSILSK